MLPLFKDAIDLACFRVKPVSHYAYTWWQPVLWLTVLSVLPALGVPENKAGITVPVGLLVAVTWLHALALTFFFGWWLKLGDRWDGQGSLFPLIVLASSSQLIAPLLNMIPPAVGIPISGVLVFYRLSVLINSLSKATGVEIKHVLVGLLLYLPTVFIVVLLALMLASPAGLLPPLPTDVGAATQQEQN
ncbi:hypothetical protein [Chitinimonas sp. JJ19]|uniref:hypothetical protein n=1 Tax=Chitinimonas sp. JJ19 TaxID=3109352 RepID=UPI003002803A